MKSFKYVGERYVVKFDGEWDYTKSYEPLILVSKDGDSYISKKFIPIGIDISNEIYWEKNSVFNSQLETYNNIVNDVVKQKSTIRYGDLSYMLQKNGFTTVITGDSLSFNRYDFDVNPWVNAYDGYAGFLSWSYMFRDSIHRNDTYFQHSDEVIFRNNKSTTNITVSEDTAYRQPFNGRYTTFYVNDNTEEIIFTYSHKNVNNKAVLYFISNPNNTACSFDIYVDGVLKSSAVNNDGTGKLYHGFEPFTISVDCTGDGALHEIKLTNFIQTAIVPEGTGKRNVFFSGIGSKFSPVYMTGQGGTTAQWLLDNIQNRVLQYNPNLVIISCGGTNELHTGISSTVYETNLRAIINAIYTYNKDTIIVLIGKPSERDPANPNVSSGSFFTDDRSKPYLDVCKKVAIDNNCYYLSITDLFENVPISSWRYDTVHLNKYGNTILSRTLHNMLMPNGLYDRKMVDSNLTFSSNLACKEPTQQHGWAYITYNGTSYVITKQSKNNAVLSVEKVDDKTIKFNFKQGTNFNSKNGFINGATLTQIGTNTTYFQTVIHSISLNYIDFYTLKSDGSYTTSTEYATPSNFNFILSY